VVYRSWAWPEFDPASGCAGSASPGGTLADWLGRVDVHLANATVFGYELRDVDAQLAKTAATGSDLACPMIAGRVDPRGVRPAHRARAAEPSCSRPSTTTLAVAWRPIRDGTVCK
jgi:hypothetical protein